MNPKEETPVCAYRIDVQITYVGFEMTQGMEIILLFYMNLVVRGAEGSDKGCAGPTDQRIWLSSLLVSSSNPYH